MKSSLRRFLSHYGMAVVLLVLCGFFSIATYTEQTTTGDTAALQISSRLAALPDQPARVLIATGAQPADSLFADQLEKALTAAGVRVVGVVKGEPKDARAALLTLAADSQPLHAIACSQAAGQWLVFASLPVDFPTLGSPTIVVPRTTQWPSFLKADNLLNIANQIAVIAIVAIGMTMVIITGGIDLSVGSLIALSAVIASRLIRDWAGGSDASVLSMIAACAAAIAIGGFIGGFSGAMITRFTIPPFIVTLAMMLVCSGLAYTLADGQSVSGLPDSFVWLGRGADWFGLPNAVLLMLVLYALAHGLMTQTRIGRHLYAVGGNREAAVVSGIRVGRVLLLAYIASGLLAGLGGVIMASQLQSGSATYGTMYELYVIAAVVVGGTSLSGGQGRMFGTLIGAFTIAVIQNGMNLTNVESYTQKVVLGLVILGAVLLDKLRRR